jgi:hypothetical protein
MENIARRQPVDQAAARVTQPGPRGLESAKRIRSHYSATPIAVRPVPDSCQDDLTGRRVGYLTVVGFARDLAKLWVCRCVCSYYVTRHARAIKNPRNQEIDRCERCRELAFLKRQDHWRATGTFGNEVDGV